MSLPGTAAAQVRLKNICRIKGQEQNSLHGLGLVVGLKGTGDGGAFLPTIRSLAAAMDLLGNQLGGGGPVELKDAKNVALVMVTATVPAAGARQGDELDCTVSSIGAAKSLAGGRLFMTPLQGPTPPVSQRRPRPGNRGEVESPRIYAFAAGTVELDDPKLPLTGRIHRGCRLEEDFVNPFTKDGRITLVLDEHHADFEVAQEIADLINTELGFQGDASRLGGGSLARAVNQLYVEVAVPRAFQDDPVLFVSQVMGLTMLQPQTAGRVVINERSGSIVIGADVEIGPAVISHKNIVIETGDNLPADRFIPFDPGRTQTTRLKDLVEALDAVKVPPEDVVDIIKGLEKNGKLHGHLIVE